MREGEFVLIWLQHCFILVWNLSGSLKRNTKMEILALLPAAQTQARVLWRDALFFADPFQTNAAFDLMSQNLLLAQHSPGRQQSRVSAATGPGSEHRQHSKCEPPMSGDRALPPLPSREHICPVAYCGQSLPWPRAGGWMRYPCPAEWDCALSRQYCTAVILLLQTTTLSTHGTPFLCIHFGSVSAGGSHSAPLQMVPLGLAEKFSTGPWPPALGAVLCCSGRTCRGDGWKQYITSEQIRTASQITSALMGNPYGKWSPLINIW